jgi:NTE family protein
MVYNYKNLIFEGGGITGIAYLGILKYLEETKQLNSVERIAGTSAGAIFGALMALGYTSDELLKIIKKTKFKKFADGSFLYAGNIFRLFKNYGWYKGDNFLKWIGELIEDKTGNSNYTFGELASNSSFKNLYVMVTNVSQNRVELLSHETTPNMPIKDAIRMSASIPVFFKAIKYNNDYYVDGGLTMNYPLNLFDCEKYLSNPNNGVKSDTGVFNFETLGFRLDRIEEQKYNRAGWQNRPSAVNNFFDMVVSIIGHISDVANKKHLNSNDWNRTVCIDTVGIKATQFKLNDSDYEKLISAGYQGMVNYTNWKVSDRHWKLQPR